MAVLFSRERFGRLYKEEGTGKKTGTRIFLRQFDTDIDDLQDVLEVDSSNDIPEIGDAWSLTETALICTNREPREIMKELQLYEIVCEYTTPSYTPGEMPWDQPWKINWSIDPVEVALEKNMQSLSVSNAASNLRLDTDDLPPSTTDSWFTNVFLCRKGLAFSENTPVLNAAFDPFDPPVVAQENWLLCELTKNYQNVTPATLLAYVNKCNSASIAIAGITGRKWQFKVKDIKISTETENSIDYYKVVYVISYAPHTQLSVVLNAGFNKWDYDTVGSRKQKILNEDGSDINSPAPLLEDGLPVPKGSIEASSQFYAFANTTTVAFAGLSLPTTM